MKDYQESMTSKELEEKKNFILNCISLGMTFNKAVIIAELHPTTIKILEEDPIFHRDVIVTEAVHEKRLLEKYKEVIDIAITKGNSKPIEWMLGNLDPDRWGGKSDELTVKGNLVITKDDEQLV